MCPARQTREGGLSYEEFLTQGRVNFTLPHWVNFRLPFLCLLMECFNHSTQRQILNYLCIQAEEIQSVYMNEL